MIKNILKLKCQSNNIKIKMFRFDNFSFNRKLNYWHIFLI